MAVSERYPRRVEIVFADSSGDRQTSELASAEAAVEIPQHVAPGDIARAAAEAEHGRSGHKALAPVVGWISAGAKDGRMLIRPVAATLETGRSSPELDEADDPREETNRISLSRAEWDGVHQAQDAAIRNIDALSGKLFDM